MSELHLTRLRTASLPSTRESLKYRPGRKAGGADVTRTGKWVMLCCPFVASSFLLVVPYPTLLWAA